jgi:hypothetical protein
MDSLVAGEFYIATALVAGGIFVDGDAGDAAAASSG